MALFTPEFAFNTLMAGNERFVKAMVLRPNQTAARRLKVAQTQAPFAAVLGCSDSRLPPEVILDCGLGDLFTVRTAGHVLGGTVLGSLEYAATHLEVSLILVLGHERCGVVKAYIDKYAKPGAQDAHSAGGHLHDLVEEIAPAAEAARKAAGNPAEMTMREHIRHTVDTIRAELPSVQKLLDQKRIGLIGARYDLDDGNLQCVCAHGVQVPKEKMLA
jgi:carbonic anhydrase